MEGDNRKDTIFTEKNVLSGETKDFRSKKSRWPRLKLEKELRKEIVKSLEYGSR